MRHDLHLVQKLQERGWQQDDLNYVRYVMSQSATQKSPNHVLLDKIIIWVIFFTIVLANIIVMFLVTPLLVLFPNNIIYLILIVLGVTFGLLFEIILRDMDHLFLHHHRYFLYVLLPYLAIVSAIVLVSIANSGLPHIVGVQRHPILMGFIYMISYILPFLIMRMISQNTKKTVIFSQ